MSFMKGHFEATEPVYAKTRQIIFDARGEQVGGIDKLITDPTLSPDPSAVFNKGGYVPPESDRLGKDAIYPAFKQ